MHWKKLLLTLFKFGISAGLLAYVIYKARQDDSFAQLRDQPKHWGFLLLACLLLLSSTMISFYRWYLLVRALDLPFRLRDAVRLGFLGYLLNFVSVGSVGGDLFKAVFIAREQHGHRTEAVATVIIDRLVGLYCLMLVASAGVLCVTLPRDIKPIADATLAATAIGTLAGLVMMVPVVTSPAVEHLVGRVPLAGGLLRRLVCAVRMYRDKYIVLFIACLASVSVHCITTVALFCIAAGLPGEHPSMGQHFVIVPLAMTTGVLPLPAGALGAVENVMEYLYLQIGGSNCKGGLMVSFGYRAITILIALIGVCYYLASRREVTALMHEAEAEQEAEEHETDEHRAPGVQDHGFPAGESSPA